MIKASEKASKVLIRDFGELEKLQVSKKGPSDFVTNSDIRAEKIIIEELKKARPNYSIISEENGFENNKDKNNTWIIDPIDGTINFLHGVPHFAISIALKTKDEIVSGVIFDPIKNEMFFAEKNNGAFFNNHRVRVSKKDKLENCLFVTGTKIKIIEALCYDKTVFAHKKSLQGIKSKFIKHFVYKDLKESENKIQNFKKNKYNNNHFKLIGKYFREKYSMKNIVKEFYVKNKL